jgi:hypothetical protein
MIYTYTGFTRCIYDYLQVHTQYWSGHWSCTVQHALVLLDLLFAIFVFCLIQLGLKVGAWGGVEGECMHTPIANGQSFLRLGFNSLSSACNCSVFVVKCFLPLLLIQIVKLCYVHFVWSPKAHS